MLEALTVERDRHDRHRNLVVAATGTGKTVVAALDYRQLLEQDGGDLSLLFVAHRAEILQQSLATYRAVLRNGAFGEIHGEGRIAEGRHVFAMVQSLHADRLDQIAPDAFDVVVVDEFHHAAAIDVRPAAKPSRAERAARPHRDARASRRQGRDRMVRPSHRRRAAALGGHRPGLPGAVSVLRCR